MVAGLVFLFIAHPTIGMVNSFIKEFRAEMVWFSDGEPSKDTSVKAPIDGLPRLTRM
jgi:hypothetical protein